MRSAVVRSPRSLGPHTRLSDVSVAEVALEGARLACARASPMRAFACLARARLMLRSRAARLTSARASPPCVCASMGSLSLTRPPPRLSAACMLASHTLVRVCTRFARVAFTAPLDFSSAGVALVMLAWPSHAPRLRACWPRVRSALVRSLSSRALHRASWLRACWTGRQE